MSDQLDKSHTLAHIRCLRTLIEKIRFDGPLRGHLLDGLRGIERDIEDHALPVIETATKN